MWVTKANLIVYCCHFLFSWGKRMWRFSMGMFLVRIADDSLQLSASYGLATGLAVFFLGTLVGDWVDNTPRLKAAQLSLAVQYILMVICAAVVAVYLQVQQLVQATNLHWLSLLLQAVIVFVAVLSNLASHGRIIAVERDWVVEICEQNFDHLASMTAMLRRLDLLGMVLAPMACGQVMNYLGLMYGAVFMAVWIVLSLLAELFLIWKVYNIVPALKAIKHSRRVEIGNERSIKNYGERGEDHVSLDQSETVRMGDKVQKEAREESNGVKATSCLARAGQYRVLYQLVTLYRGGRTYLSYSVALPGLSLALLYLTVLGIDNITVAYTISQGLSESVVGILVGSSAVFGIMGTFAYPLIRHRVGLARTGFISLSCQLSVLTLCVVSIWMPGSPFDPFYTNTKLRAQVEIQCNGRTQGLDVMSEMSANVSQNATPTTVNFQNSSMFYNITLNATTTTTTGAISSNNNINGTGSNNMCNDVLGKRGPDSYMSVIFLLAGVFLGRFGVYMADLSITQLFLEKVVPAERGIVNGVQTSLNQLMDLLKFALVVALPDTQTFGFVIIISFCSIATAWVFYLIFVRREGLPLCSVQVCCPGRSSEALQGPDRARDKSYPDSASAVQEGSLDKGAVGDV